MLQLQADRVHLCRGIEPTSALSRRHITTLVAVGCLARGRVMRIIAGGTRVGLAVVLHSIGRYVSFLVTECVE